MKWMNSLFNWATSLVDCQTVQGDYPEHTQYFLNYFGDGGVCSKLFFTSLALALGLNIIYYLLCRFSFSLAKRRYWLLSILLVFGIVFFVCKGQILGKYSDNPDKCTNFYFSIGDTETFLVNQCEPDLDLMDHQRVVAELVRNELLTDTRTIESLPSARELVEQLALVSGFYALIFFFLFSLVNKRWSIHATAIPF